jgi:hypothetical protein
MSQELEQGLDHWHSIAQCLNDEIRKSGEIAIDNRRIWDGYLHRWNNDDWAMILIAFDQLMTDHPNLVKPFHRDAFETAKGVYLDHCDDHARCLDTRQTKRHAWRMIMSLREVWNAVNNINLPNQ